jgi:outer membrane receptor protein involved in Fe transport
MRQDVTTKPRTTIKGGLGEFRQPPQPQETNTVFGQKGLSSNRATHYGLGVERELTKQIEVSFEGFYRDLDNLVVQGSGNSGSGRAFGSELLLRYKPDDRFFGFLAYTLSRSTRRDRDGEAERLFQYDQTHILTVLGSYRLGRGWEIGGRFRLISGSMSTPQQYGMYDQNAGAYLPLSYPTNGERLPIFHQLDIRVDKTWQFKHWKLAAYLDLWNSYNAPNVEGVSYNYNSSQRIYGGSLPIIPSLGIRGEL